MNFHVLTLFPEMIMNGLETSILGRAAAKGIVSFEAVNIRDYTLERHGKVDDYPYGGGAGMVMQAEPIYRAYEALVEKIGKKPRVIYMTPQGQTFNQGIAVDLAKEEDLVFLCGHYEGVDERVLDENGNVDIAKVAPIIYDPFNNDYLKIGEKVGKAYSDGKRLK